MCQSVQSMERPSFRDQYLRDIVKPAGLKNDVNSIRSIERNDRLLAQTVNSKNTESLHTDTDIMYDW